VEAEMSEVLGTIQYDFGVSESDVAKAAILLDGYCKRTGVDSSASGKVPGTRSMVEGCDGMALCTMLELHRRTADPMWESRSRMLIEQVHSTLGNHRKDDRKGRRGWLSGRKGRDAELHPTCKGLRCGAPRQERDQGTSYVAQDEVLRDGQHYHGLCRWAHALCQASVRLVDPLLGRLAMEMIKGTHPKFLHTNEEGLQLIFWKLSCDLRYPLVRHSGQHDPIEGFCAYHHLLLALPSDTSADSISLGVMEDEIHAILRAMAGHDWMADDLLGLATLLCMAYKAAQLVMSGSPGIGSLPEMLLSSAATGLTGGGLELLHPRCPAHRRTPWHEFAFATGLQAVQRIMLIAQRNPALRRQCPALHSQAQAIWKRHGMLKTTIQGFWEQAARRRQPCWSNQAQTVSHYSSHPRPYHTTPHHTIPFPDVLLLTHIDGLYTYMHVLSLPKWALLHTVSPLCGVWLLMSVQHSD